MAVCSRQWPNIGLASSQQPRRGRALLRVLARRLSAKRFLRMGAGTRRGKGWQDKGWLASRSSHLARASESTTLHPWPIPGIHGPSQASMPCQCPASALDCQRQTKTKLGINPFLASPVPTTRCFWVHGSWPPVRHAADSAPWSPLPYLASILLN